MKAILAFALMLAATVLNASQRDSYVLHFGGSGEPCPWPAPRPIR